MPTDTVNVAIVDNNILFRKVLKYYLSEQENINVSIQASDIFDLFDKLRDVHVDILMLDIFIPKLNSRDVLRELRNRYAEIKILVLSVCTDLQLISDLLDFGIHGYISKTDEPEELLKAITTISGNRIHHNRLFTEALYWNKQNNGLTYGNEPSVKLNEREKKILQLVWEENSNKEIADQLFLSVRSIEKIRQDMKDKLGVKSTVGLLKYAATKGIITVPLNSSVQPDYGGY